MKNDEHNKCLISAKMKIIILKNYFHRTNLLLF